jgi:rare lipoprotein A
VLEKSHPRAKRIPGKNLNAPKQKTAVASISKTGPKPVKKSVPDSVQTAPKSVLQQTFYEIGKASFYADKFQFRRTASGERFDQKAKTAAHRRLPFGTKVKVTNKQNQKSVIVTINDRDPFVKGRIIDLSRFAFSRIGNTRDGILDVGIQIIDQNDPGLHDYDRPAHF